MDVIKAQSILIIPKQSSNQHLWSSAAALGSVLIEQGKTVHYFVTDKYRKSIPQIIDADKHLHSSSRDNELLVKLERVENQVTELDWNQHDTTVEIKLTSKDGAIGTPDIAMSHTKQTYDLRIFIGLDKTESEDVPELSDSELLSGTSIYLTSSDPDEVIPLMVFRFIKQVKYKISGEVGEMLMKSLRESTDNFTANVTSETFLIAAELMKTLQTEKPQPQKPEKPVKTKETEPAKVAKPKIAEEVNLNDIEGDSFAIPEELPPDYDPLMPATNIPTPIKLSDEPVAPKPQVNTPLPEAT